jgi:hypothetical protein
MSSTDKTRQQLVDSMRKTKAAAASTNTAGNKAPRPTTRAAKTTKKAASTTKAKRSAKVEVRSRPETPDPYRVGRRVWPD